MTIQSSNKMTLSRIYTKQTLNPNKTITLEEQASSHLIRVLRKQIGDCLIVFNGDGGEFNASIVVADKNKTQIQLDSFNAINRESSLQLNLVQTLLRNEKMDWVIQKATELGIKKITPIITERCEVRLNQERLQKRMQHWQAVIISACEQSGRTSLPTLLEPIKFDDWLSNQATDLNLMMAPNTDTKLTQLEKPATPINIMIGPEGGFSDNELTTAEKQGCQLINFGPRILRTETAGLASIAAIQTLWGDN